jgi:hypothetical protein
MQLLEAKAQLDKVVADQKALNQMTQAGSTNRAALAEQQAEINDRADAANMLVNDVSAQAGKEVDLAQQGMDEDASKLKKGQGPSETNPEQDKIDQKLANAERLLQQQIASLKPKKGKQGEEAVAMAGKEGDEEGDDEGGMGEDEKGAGEDPSQERNPEEGKTGAGTTYKMQLIKPTDQEGNSPLPAQVLGTLSPKDRDAISRYQEEKTPPEYAPMVQQYQKDLTEPNAPQ